MASGRVLDGPGWMGRDGGGVLGCVSGPGSGRVRPCRPFFGWQKLASWRARGGDVVLGGGSADFARGADAGKAALLVGVAGVAVIGAVLIVPVGDGEAARLGAIGSRAGRCRVAAGGRAQAGWFGLLGL